MKVFDVQHEFQGSFTSTRATTKYIVVHHAAALYPTGTGIEDVRAVARYHTRDKGWSGIGYHVCLAEEINGGPVARYNVSDLNLQRAHILNRNHECVGVACLTNFTDLPDPKWIDALVVTLRDLKHIYPHATIVGHKEIAVPGGETICPGPRWNDWKPTLLARVAASEEPAPPQPWGTFPVHPALRSYHERSGGIWQPNRLAPGFAISEFDPATRVQQFERAAFRLKADGTVEALLRSEWS